MLALAREGPRASLGCCRLDGLAGPDLICPNGHEVGTEDRWMPQAAVFLEDVTGINECQGLFASAIIQEQWQMPKDFRTGISI